MDNIIGTILEIENEAKNRVSSAEQKSSDIMKQTKQISEKRRNDIKSASVKKVEEFEKSEQLKILKAQEEIDSMCREKNDMLQKIYDDNHDKWEHEIYNGIVGE